MAGHLGCSAFLFPSLRPKPYPCDKDAFSRVIPCR